MAAMYAVYHGPNGLRQIAAKVHGLTYILKEMITSLNGSPYTITNTNFFDTLTIKVDSSVGADILHAQAEEAKINLRRVSDGVIGVTLDESVGLVDLLKLANVFVKAAGQEKKSAEELISAGAGLKVKEGEVSFLPEEFRRTSKFMTHPVFNTHHSETEMLRYIYHLQSKDLSLVHAMIPLGSCTFYVFRPFSKPFRGRR
jgi:glycine dehydrogenase